MTDTTLLQRIDDGAGSRRDDHDRTTIHRLGKLFVLAVGVLLVLVTAATVYDLVSSLIGDAFAASGPAGPAAP